MEIKIKIYTYSDVFCCCFVPWKLGDDGKVIQKGIDHNAGVHQHSHWGQKRDCTLAGSIAAVLDIQQKKENLLNNDWARLKWRGYNVVTPSIHRACFHCSQRSDQGIHSNNNRCDNPEDDAGKITHFCCLCQTIFRALGIKSDGKLLSEVTSGKTESILTLYRLEGDCRNFLRQQANGQASATQFILLWYPRCKMELTQKKPTNAIIFLHQKA